MTRLGRTKITKFNFGLIVLFGLVMLITATVKKTTEGVQTASVKGEEQSENIAANSPTESIAATKIESSPTTSPKPQRAKIKLGIVVDDYANNTGTITSLENLLGVTFSTVSIYKQFGHPTNKYLIDADVSFIANSGKTLMVAWEPWNPLEGKSQSKDYLKEITLGNLDEYIKSFAAQIKNYGKPTVIRFGHEMNGNWYSWSGRPDDYKKAYVKIVEIFRSLGVGNAKFNWSVNSENVPPAPFSDVSKYYPGSAYVDSIGIDGYNWGTANSTGWRSFTQIFTTPYNYMANYQKPLIITEVASAEVGGNKALWIENMSKELNTKFINVNEIVWFNLLKETDWRIESTQSSLNSFKTSF